MTTKSDAVRAFYRSNPYPSYGAQIRRHHIDWYKKYCTKPGRYLEAGCGTGHIMLGIATSLPQHQYWAIDFSDKSIEVARQLARDHGVDVTFRVHNLMEPLPFEITFDYINCIGVIHHLESPETGLMNLAARLSDDGYLFLHAYGEDYHRRRLQIVEMLDILQGGEEDFEARFDLFAAYCQHHRRLTRGNVLKRLYRTSPRDLLLPLIQAAQRALRRGHADPVHTWYDEMKRPGFSNRWLDQFANPNDRTYNLREFCDLLDTAGLEPLDMVSLGRHRPEHLPPAWQPGFEHLAAAERYRVMELLNPAPTSPTVVARKKR